MPQDTGERQRSGNPREKWRKGEGRGREGRADWELEAEGYCLAGRSRGPTCRPMITCEVATSGGGGGGGGGQLVSVANPCGTRGSLWHSVTPLVLWWRADSGGGHTGLAENVHVALHAARGEETAEFQEGRRRRQME